MTLKFYFIAPGNSQQSFTMPAGIIICKVTDMIEQFISDELDMSYITKCHCSVYNRISIRYFPNQRQDAASKNFLVSALDFNSCNTN